MRNDAFYEWLMNVDGRDRRQASDNVSRARRIECSLAEYLKKIVKLDVEYSKDRCTSILDMLSIEYASRIPAKINLPKDRNGLSSLRTGVRKYIKFCDKTKQ